VTNNGDRTVVRVFQRAEGATAVEYAIIVSLIAAVIVVTVRTIGLWLPGGFQSVINALTP
jgi:Flp pilus assembly pilin Flp